MRTVTRVGPATARKLRDIFEELLGTKTASERKVVQLVESGLPVSVLDRLLERGLSKTEVSEVIVPARTLKHRKSKRQPLSTQESERVVRAARVMSMAASVLGDNQSALKWLRAPKKRFEGRTPMELLATEPGGRLVEEMLIQIDEGMFA